MQNKITYIVADNSKSTIISCIKNVIVDVHYEHKYFNIEQMFKSNILISEDKITLNNQNGLKIKRMRIKILILCPKCNLNSKCINDIRNTCGKIMDIYVETIDDIYEYITKQETETFAFRNILFDLFKPYKNIDYLIII